MPGLRFYIKAKASRSLNSIFNTNNTGNQKTIYTVVPGFRVLGFSALPGFRALKAGDGAWSVH